MSGKVSVIIPTYNYAHFLEDCLNSVLNQIYDNIEIIVVDDGSTDHTKELISQYSEKIEYIYQENSGLSSARNKGIEHSSGEFVQFLDSDDLLHPKAIEDRINYFKLNPDCKILICRNKTFTNVKNGKPKITGSWPLNRGNLDVHLCFFNVAPPIAYLCKSEVIEKVGNFDISLKACEDYDYWLRALACGYIPEYCNEGIVFYRKHGESMSENRLNQYYHDGLLHIRLFNLLYLEKKIVVTNKIGASLAFICGLMTTINRLAEYNHEMGNELANLIKPSFDNLYENFGDREQLYTYESLYYLLKLNKLSVLSDNQVKNFVDIFRRDYLNDRYLNSNIGILVKALFNQKIDYINKLRLLRISI